MKKATDMQREDLFDSIDDLLDFQNYDDLLEMMDGSDNGGSVAPSSQAPAIAGEIHGLPAAVTGGRINSEVDALRCLCEDVEIINSDWLSNIFEDSELSPLSVLETKIVSPKTRARTKRPRAHVTPSLTRWVPEPEIMEKGRKMNVGDKRCLHCDSQKTPQWRAGPTGPKTLCNACGVRYKSGRLFPEYRPVASPSFIPSIHSNSHKKVVEMRQQRANLSSRDGEVATKNWDLLDYIKN